MEYKSPRNLFDIVCLSIAVGLLLYWVMFITVLPRLMKPEASTMLPLLSGIIGSVSCALSFIGLTGLITSARSKPKLKQTLVLRRSEGGGVASIGWAEAEYVTKTGAVKAKTAQPIQVSPRARSQSKAKKMVIVAVSITMILSSHASLMAMMGYTAQDLMNGMYSPFMIVSSQSMQPTLNYGDLILVRKEPAERIAVGDIIAFNVPSPYNLVAQSPTIHKVVEKLNEDGETYFKTKGDNNPTEDQWKVPAKNVIGKYAGKVPYIGLAALFLRSPLGLAVIAVLIALLVIHPYFKKKQRGGTNL